MKEKIVAGALAVIAVVVGAFASLVSRILLEAIPGASANGLVHYLFIVVAAGASIVIALEPVKSALSREGT